MSDQDDMLSDIQLMYNIVAIGHLAENCPSTQWVHRTFIKVIRLCPMADGKVNHCDTAVTASFSFKTITINRLFLFED